MRHFTEDWLICKPDYWWPALNKYTSGPLNCLEIGSFEGRSAVWILEHLKDSKLTCIDTFVGSTEHTKEQVCNLRTRFDDNTLEFKERLTVYQDLSHNVLPNLKQEYDFIYVDGSHEYPDVLNDALGTWNLLKPGGIIVFDDWHPGWPGVVQALNEFMGTKNSEILETYQGYDQLIFVKVSRS